MTLNIFGTKAKTILTLSDLVEKSIVEDFYITTEEEWLFERRRVLGEISRQFSGDTVVVRSSAISEDTTRYSNAGSYKSVLNVHSDDPCFLASSIDEVVESYRRKDASDPRNQILVQRQTTDVAFSGILLTRNYNGAPYYIINFSQGQDTTSVTSGKNGKSIKILRNYISNSPKEFSRLLEAVQEIESLAGHLPLDYEFAVKNDETVVTFQVRPLCASLNSLSFDIDQVFQRVYTLQKKFEMLSQRREHLAGDYTILADMPDWNPAEIIGNSPNPLAFSLYGYIITNSAWHEARTSQGYYNVNPAQLVHLIGNKPYVDVRNSFNSFTPTDILPDLRERLVTFYLDKLRNNPQLQDKVEFEVLYTIYDPSFKSRTQELRNAGFYDSEINNLGESLLALTNDLLDIKQIERDIALNEEMEEQRKTIAHSEYGNNASDRIRKAFDLLDLCREKGTVQFSRLARQGFVGKIMLKSLLSTGVIDYDTYSGFLASIETIATEFSRDSSLFRSGEMAREGFMVRYGHLRPGTYDITVPRYDKSEHYHSGEGLLLGKISEDKCFEFSEQKHDEITALLNGHGIKTNSRGLFRFIKSAFTAREYSKFLFTKCLSDAMETIADAGETVNLSREDMSYLDLETVRRGIGKDNTFVRNYWQRITNGYKRKRKVDELLCLPAVISSLEDFLVVKSYQPRPNYITNQITEADIVCLDDLGTENHPDISNKIVALESADPGYDWIFAKRPAGLLTKYGGVASHMAIRCAEFKIPAAIGCGDLYDTVKRMKTARLDCAKEQIAERGQVL